MRWMARIRRDPSYDAHFLAHVGANVKKITEAIAADAIAACPIDTGDLVESIGTRYPGKLRGIVIVGTPHWSFVEYGTQPHIIESHGPWSLHNEETGEYFGRIVNHPGTTAQPYMRPALFRKRRLS